MLPGRGYVRGYGFVSYPTLHMTKKMQCLRVSIDAFRMIAYMDAEITL